jgi:hypothetical protein
LAGLTELGTKNSWAAELGTKNSLAAELGTKIGWTDRIRDKK